MSRVRAALGPAAAIALVAVSVALGAEAPDPAPAASASSTPDADPVIARVGPRAIRASRLARRVAALPRAHYESLGADDGGRRRAVLDWLVREELQSLGAEGAGEGGAAPRRQLEAPVLAGALRTAFRRRVSSSLSDEDVRQRAERLAAETSDTERVRLWRVLVADEATAREVIAVAQGDGGVQRWTDAARERSLDEGSRYRKGDLGFVAADGTTEWPTLRVEPALFEAAAGVADGALVPEPVREGPHWAAVWRRGTRPARPTSSDVYLEVARALLIEERTAVRVQELLAELRARGAAHVQAEALETLPDEAVSEEPSRAPQR